MSRFTGWPREAFDVLLQLDGEPSPEVRERCRRDRERLVRQPMIALMNDVADADGMYEDFSVWSFGKMVWYWQHQPAVVRIRKFLELSLGFDLDGLQVQGAWWYAPGLEIERYRQAVDKELSDIVEALRAKGFTITGDVMKRIPRGYDRDHPHAELLRHRTLLAQRPLGCDDWLHTPQVVDRVLAAFGELRPMMSWFSTHVSVS
jgi:hypothetical protein